MEHLTLHLDQVKEESSRQLQLVALAGSLSSDLGDFHWLISLFVTGSGKRAHLAQVINFQFIALSERAFFVLSNAL